MKIPHPKRGWHIAQIGEYCPEGKTAVRTSGKSSSWVYCRFFGGYTYTNNIFKMCSLAIRNH